MAALDVTARAASGDKPNVVIMFIDDLGYGDTGPFGCTDIPTPNLDRLAAEGVVCTQSYITNPPCCPSRCSLMMGMYGGNFGKYGMSRGLPIPEDKPTLAEFMRDNGYGRGASMWIRWAATKQRSAAISKNKMPKTVDWISWSCPGKTTSRKRTETQPNETAALSGSHSIPPV